MEQIGCAAVPEILRHPRLCCIEIQVRTILDRDQFLALHLARRSIFWVSPVQKILFPYTKDTFCGSLDTEPVSCICIAAPNFMYRAQPYATVSLTVGSWRRAADEDQHFQIVRPRTSIVRFAPISAAAERASELGHVSPSKRE